MAANEAEQWPRTLDEAVDTFISLLKEDARARFASMEKGDLICLHSNLGLFIRDEFGLWKGNTELLAACQEMHPDEASSRIIEEAWRKLRMMAAKSEEGGFSRKGITGEQTEEAGEPDYFSWLNDDDVERQAAFEEQKKWAERVVTPLLKKHLEEIYPEGHLTPGLYGWFRMWTGNGILLEFTIPFEDETDFDRFQRPFSAEVMAAANQIGLELWMEAGEEAEGPED